jgi:hypothetical protein
MKTRTYFLSESTWFRIQSIFSSRVQRSKPYVNGYPKGMPDNGHR